MGKGIVYCGDCGKSLREEDFARNRAQTIDSVPYCTGCRPLDATPPTGSIKKVSSPRQAPLPSRRPAPPPKSRLPLVLGAAGGGLLLVAVLIVALSSGGGPPEAASPPPPVRPPDPPALVALEKFAASSADPEAILFRADELRESLRGTPHEARLRKVEARALELRASRGSERFERFLPTIRALIADDPEFRKKLEVEAMIRSAYELAGARAGEVRKLEQDYRDAFDQAAAAACRAARDEALRLAQSEDFAAAAERLSKVPPAFLETSSGRPLPELRRQYEARHQELAQSARAWIEGESLPVLAAPGEAHPQDMKPFPGAWSQGAQLWWRNAKPGDVLRLEFHSAAAGRRRLHLGLTAAPDYGIVRISVNGTVVVEQADLYAAKVSPLPETGVEAVLRKGPNELRVEITGTNPAAKPANHMFGLDYLRIE